MDMYDYEEDLSFGRSDKGMSDMMRDFIAAAMADPRKDDIQLSLLNDALERAAEALPGAVVHEVAEFFADLGNVPAPGPDMTAERRDQMMKGRAVALLTSGRTETVKYHQIPINKERTDFTEADIMDLPGYADLHESAESMNVAVRVVGLTPEEPMKPMIIIDIGKKYEEGRNDSVYGYPEPPPSFEAAPPAALPQAARVQKRPRSGGQQVV